MGQIRSWPSGCTKLGERGDGNRSNTQTIVTGNTHPGCLYGLEEVIECAWGREAVLNCEEEDEGFLEGRGSPRVRNKELRHVAPDNGGVRWAEVEVGAGAGARLRMAGGIWATSGRSQWTSYSRFCDLGWPSGALSMA